MYPSRFVAAYAALALIVLGCVAGIAVGLRGQLPVPPRSTGHPARLCVRVACAQLGDHVEYEISGRVTQVSSPQPGVVCAQVAASSSVGDKCELAQ